MDGILQNIFWFGIGELIVILLSYLARNDKRIMVIILVVGTMVSGVIGFREYLGSRFQGFSSQLGPLPISSTLSAPQSISFAIIPIKQWSELDGPETNLGLSPGDKILEGVPFETGWVSSTECIHLPNQPEVLIIGAEINKPSKVHFLIQVGHGLLRYEDIQIGSIQLFFSSGNSYSIPLILGFNIRDWSWENPDAVTTTTSLDTKPAWQGVSPEGIPGGMDILTIALPEEFSNSTLTEIRIIDMSQESAGEINPCIHLLVLTVAYFE